MKYIGAHFNISNGFNGLVNDALEFGANSFALFTKPSLQWNAKIITEDVGSSFINECQKHFFPKEAILPHASYMINMGNPDETKSRNAQIAFTSELKRCKQLGLSMLNFHPGSYLTSSLDEAIKQIGRLVKESMDQVESVIPVYEMMAGQGTNIGFELEQMRDLIAESDDKCGICIDTCHVFAAGYDIRTEEGWNDFMDKFDEIIGHKHLMGIHLNDSMTDLGSKKDRHENLGFGKIRIGVFKALIKDKRTDNIPLILETPDASKWKEEIKMLKSFQ